MIRFIKISDILSKVKNGSTLYKAVNNQLKLIDLSGMAGNNNESFGLTDETSYVVNAFHSETGIELFFNEEKQQANMDLINKISQKKRYSNFAECLFYWDILCHFIFLYTNGVVTGT
ncbi:hypothetical protein [Lentibacillus amyloliquefaciens]|uniref:Uncharacterized protein n=1 Tax=Lentibacillus amyloliquefaciens TaxID=1472767 RepID=A0A0U4FWA9_9BACI|nr:hypothetical protein [Lentibacillus amyloliquefaciens]ALX50037.1 hypothetical protein AOX59_16495 [Lentibacillus amyloliquefaciens]